MRAAHQLEPDVCIVGAGVMGLSLAWELVRRGRRVICFDRSAPGREASAATAGTLAVQNKPLGSVPLTLLALRMWRDLSRELGFDVEYEVRGGIRVAHTDDDIDRLTRSAAAQQSAGATVELVEPPKLFALAPYLSQSIRLGAYCPDDGMANPFAAVRGLVRACRAAGVQFEFQRPVERVFVSPDGNIRIQAGTLTIETPAAVLASGAWIRTLVESLRIILPVATRVQQVLITDGGPDLLPHIVTHVRGNLTLKQQAMSGKVLIGGGWTGIGDETSGVRRLARGSIVGNARAAIGTVPALAGRRLLRAWTGFEGRTPDKLPLIGPLPGIRNLHLLGCASGGLTLAPACGHLLAQRLTDQRTDLPLDAFSPERCFPGGEQGISAAAAGEFGAAR